jgi:hypothetical protein
LEKKSRPAVSRRKSAFDFEASSWFVPLVFVILLVALVVLFSKFVFSDQMLRGGDTLQTGYMFRHFYVEYFREHWSVPQWIPYYFGGMPYIEAFHGDIFYPFSILKFIGSLERMLGWLMFLHIFLAGVCMYFAARQFKMSRIPSLVAGAAYMFAAYLVSLVAPGHDGKLYVTAWFPLIMLFLDRGFERKPFLNFTILGLVIGIVLLTPHVQMAYYSLWALSFYAAFKLVCLWRATKSIGPLIRPAAFTTYAVVLGILLSAIQFYPGYVYTTNFSPRADAKRGWEWATSWSLHEEEAMGLIIPEFAGIMSSSGDTETYYWGKNAFKDNAETVSAATFFVALMGFLLYRRKESYFFGALALFAVIYAVGGTTPVFKLFYWVVPLVKSLRAPSNVMFLFVFSASMLAAMGLQAIIDSRQERRTGMSRRFLYVLVGYPAFLLLLALLFTGAGKGMLNLWTSIFYSDAAQTLVQQGVSKLDVAYMNLPAIQSGAWIAFLVTAIAAGCIWLYQSGKLGVGILMGVLAVIVVDGVRFDKRFISLVDKQEFRARFEPTPLVNFMKEQPDKFRVINYARLDDNTFPFFGVDAVVGYHGNQLRWYDDLLGGKELTNIRSYNPRLLNLTGAKYLMVPGSSQLPPEWFGAKPATTIASMGSSTLIRNDNILPRVFLVDRYQVIPQRADVVKEVISGTSDLRAAVLLEEPPSLEIPSDAESADSAWIADYQMDSVKVGVSVTRNKMLVMTENYYDAWQVTVDGTPAKLLRAYGSFRAVAVPAGSKEVKFVFYSPRYVAARTVTWLTTLYLLAVFGFLFVADRRKRRAVEPSQQEEIQS